MRRRRRSKKGGRSTCYYKYHGKYVTAKEKARMKRKSHRRK